MSAGCRAFVEESIVRTCESCGGAYDRSGFSGAQWKNRSKTGRRCLDCVASEGASEGDGGWLTCTCGKVEFNIPCKSVLRYECCCCDCNKFHVLCHAKGGAPPPPVADLVYYPNAFMIERGLQHLRCFTIQRGYPSRRVVATCCWTAMLADHPYYEGKRVAMYNGPATLKSTGTAVQGRSPLLPADDRIFQADMTPEQLAALPTFRRPAPAQGCARTWEGATSAAVDAIAAMKEADGSWKRRYVMWDLITVQELIEQLPTGVEVADPAHFGPAPLWGQ